MNKNNSKGFFFVLISFILVMYIFLYLTAWINAIEIAEKTSSEKFRVANFEGIVSQLSEERFNEFFTISGYYALFKINAHASDIAHPMKYADEEGNSTYYLGDAFFKLVQEGNTSDDFEGEEISYTDKEKNTYTFSSWLANLNRILAPTGLDIKEFNISGQNFTQDSPVTFNASINISILVEDKFSTLSIRRTFALHRQFNITGFSDPMISRESRIIFGNPVERQIFYKDITPQDIAPIKMGNGTMGQGFFYGPMVRVEDVSATYPLPSQKSEYILVGNYADIIDNRYYRQFGAYILTNAPDYVPSDNPNCPDSESNTFMALRYTYSPTTSTCTASIVPDTATSSPFVVIPDFNLTEFSGPGAGNKKRHSALFISKYSADEVNALPTNKLNPVDIYDIEKLRDATVCTYFIKSSRAPSYPQRLSRNALTLNDEEFGITTFLVGTWAGGKDMPTYDKYSRVDFEFFQNNPWVEGIKIRGMPGCKNVYMCNISVGESAPLGHFRLTTDSIEEYGAESIACNDGRAGCD